MNLSLKNKIKRKRKRKMEIINTIAYGIVTIGLSIAIIVELYKMVKK